MFTKNAIGNMINRYTAVLSKCRLLNVFGTLALACTIVGAGPYEIGGMGKLGGLFGVGNAYAVTTSAYDPCTVVDYADGGTYYTDYYTTYTITDGVGTLGGHKGVVLTPKRASAGVTTIDAFILGYTTDGGYTFTRNADAYSFDVGIQNTYYVKAPDTPSGTTYIGITTGPALSITTSDTSVTADFIANKNSNDTNEDGGGAIYNNATNTKITGDFIGNVRTSNAGAIYNDSSIDSITGNFISNISTLQGAAIYNNDNKTIESITGNFIGNKANGAGGAICNSGVITTLRGDFIGNSADGFGGAIWASDAQITTITGNFINNSAGINGSGGAICNIIDSTTSCTIGSITGDFIGNKAGKQGGAIYNSGAITSISGDFVGNSTGSYGGAIYSASSGNLGTITGDFIGNKATGSYGGAIYTCASMASTSFISGDFIGNKSGNYGGAIYAEGNLNFLSAGKGYSFTNNVVGSGETADYNAIYLYKQDAVVTFNLGDTSNALGSFTMNDSISTVSRFNYSVAITGEGTGDRTFNLNDEISSSGTVTVAGATMKLGTFAHTGATDTSGTPFVKSTVGSVFGSLIVGTTGASGKTSKLLVNITDVNQIALINDLTVNTGSTAVVEAGTLKLTGTGTFNGTMTASTAGTTIDIVDNVIFDHANLTSDISKATIVGNGSIAIKNGTLVAGFDDFVTNAGAPANANAEYGDTTLSLTGLKDRVTLASGATLTLDGEEAYVNKEDFAEFLKGTGTDSWGEFVNSASCVIDYSASQSPDNGSATLDNIYTFNTGNGTITVTNVNLSNYYSLSRFLATADPNDGSYNISEAVISGTLTSGTTLTAATLLKGVDDTIIEDGATLTLTGAGYAEGTEMEKNKGVLANAGANVINNGSLNLGESGNTNTLTFGGDLTTGETGTTTAASAIEIAGAVTGAGMVTFEGETTLKDTLTINGGKTIFKKTATVEGLTTVTVGALGIGSSSSYADVTLAGVNVSEKGVFDIDNGKVVLTGDSTFEGMLFMGQGTGIVADGVQVTVQSPSITPDAYFFAKGSGSSMTVKSFNTIGDGYALSFSAYADGGGKLIFGALPQGEDKTQFDYIASQMGGTFDAKDMLYIGLGKTLTIASGASLVVDGAPLDVSNTPTSTLAAVPTSMLRVSAVPSSKPNITPNTGAIFGVNSLFIANVAGLGADQAVISGGGNALTVASGAKLGLVNAAEGTYTILNGFGNVTNADKNAAGNTVPWAEKSVTIGNCLLVVDSVTGSGTDADPYKVKVRQDVNEHLFDTDGGGALKDVMNSGEYKPDTKNPLAQYLYQAGEKGDEALAKAKANTATAGANAGSGMAGMTVTRAAAASTFVRNTVVHVGEVETLAAAGGTLLIKDANGNVKAEYDNVVQVADNGSISDAPTSLGTAGTGIGNSIGLWAMPFYGHESISGMHVGAHSNDTRTDMYGMTMGVDKTFTPSGIDVCRFGLAFNVGTGETEGSGYTGSSESDFDFFGLAAYGSMRKGAAMFSGSVSYTNTDGEFNSEGIRGETDTDVWYGVLNGEYAFDMGTLENSVFFSNFNVVPYAGIGFMTNKVDDYTTSLGSPVKTDRQNVFTFPVGLKFNNEFTLDSGWIVKPEIGAGVIFGGGDLYQRTVTGNSLGSNLDTIQSQVMDRTTIDLGFSFDMRKDDFGIFFDYSLEKSDTRTAHGVSAKVEYRF